MAAQGGSERGDERAVPAGTKHNAPAGRPPLTVERLTHLDVPEICGLFKRVWDSFPDLPSELVKAWEPTPLEFTSWMEGVTYFAARREGRMIGAIGCKITDESCQLVHLAVDPDARRQGVATALTRSAVDWAKHNKSLSVWADALARFTAAAQMFKRLGFAECGVLHKHYWGEDVRLFEKIL